MSEHGFTDVLSNFADMLDTMPDTRTQIQGAMWDSGDYWKPNCAVCAAGWVIECLYDHDVPQLNRMGHSLNSSVRERYEQKFDASVRIADLAKAMQFTISVNDGLEEPDFSDVAMRLREQVQEEKHANA
jgi:hypothetical protein